MSTRHPQVRQREQRHQLRGILGQTTEAHLHEPNCRLITRNGYSTLARPWALAFSILRLVLYSGLRLLSFLYYTTAVVSRPQFLDALWRLLADSVEKVGLGYDGGKVGA